MRAQRCSSGDDASKWLVGKASKFDGQLWDDKDPSAEAASGQLKTSNDYRSADTSASIADLWESESSDEKPSPADVGQPPLATMENREALSHIKSVAKGRRYADLSMMTHLNGEAVYKDQSDEHFLLPRHTGSIACKGGTSALASSSSLANPRGAREAQPKAGYIADLAPAAPFASAEKSWGGSDIVGVLFEDAEEGEGRCDRPPDEFFECDSGSDTEVVSDKAQGTFEDAHFLDMVKRHAQARSTKRHPTDVSMVTHVNGDAVPEEERPDLLESLLRGGASSRVEDRSVELVRSYLAKTKARPKGADVRGTFADSKAVEAVKRQAQATARAHGMLSDDLSNNAAVDSDF